MRIIRRWPFCFLSTLAVSVNLQPSRHLPPPLPLACSISVSHFPPICYEQVMRTQREEDCSFYLLLPSSCWYGAFQQNLILNQKSVYEVYHQLWLQRQFMKNWKKNNKTRQQKWEFKFRKLNYRQHISSPPGRSRLKTISWVSLLRKWYRYRNVG